MVTIAKRIGCEYEDAGTCPTLEKAIELAVESFLEHGLDCESVIVVASGKVIGKVNRRVKNRRVQVTCRVEQQ